MTPNGAVFAMQDHVVEHLLEVGSTQILLPLLEATAFRGVRYLQAVYYSPRIFSCLALPMLLVLRLPTLGETVHAFRFVRYHSNSETYVVVFFFFCWKCACHKVRFGKVLLVSLSMSCAPIVDVGIGNPAEWA